MTSKRQTIATFLAESGKSQSHLTIEISKLIMDPSEVVALTKAMGTPIATQSIVKLFYQKAEKLSCDTQKRIFASDKSVANYMNNEQVREFFINQNSTKLIATKISQISNVPQTADRVAIIRRFSFLIEGSPNWLAQLDLVRELNNPKEFESRLRSCKQQLLDTELSEMNLEAYDYVRTNLEQIGVEPTTAPEILELIDKFQTGDGDHSLYQEMIHKLAKEIFFRDPVMVSQFKRQSGFKRLCNNTVELSRPIYFKQVMPVIDSFYITDKMDGVRAMLVIDEQYRKNGSRKIDLGADIYAVSDKVYNILQSNAVKATGSDLTVLDVEMLTEGKFYCFDVITIKSKRLSGYPFKTRIQHFDEAKALMDKYDLGGLKTFVKLTKEGYAKQIQDMYSEKRDYHIDGIIFTPEGMDYKAAIAAKKNKYDRIFNTGYTNTISFKWKPLDQLTIDFYLMAHPSKKGSYVLCSGIDANTFALLKMSFFKGYKAPDAPNSYKYFPIQFEPYDGEFNYEWTPTDQTQSLDGMVGEFTFAKGDTLLETPKLLRLRTDRVQDIAKGEYYGNALRYAELIWHSIRYPLTIKAMGNPSDVGYFADNNNDWYHAQRGFNSFVKTYLMETYLYNPSAGSANLIDIAAGKGQDLARAIDIGFDEILLMDKDTDAIYELLERKYNLRVKRKGAAANVHVKRVDLEYSSERNVKDLKLPEHKFQSCMINFAIHYIAHSASVDQQDPLTEFAKFVSYNLKSGGRLMITAFNGEDVFRLLVDKPEWELKENGRVKYSIKREFNSKEFMNTDQSIGVMLPFSGSVYYNEYLVNYTHLQDVFEKNGFKLVKSDSFASLSRTYKKQNPKGYEIMSAADREYVGLYGYLIFEKN